MKKLLDRIPARLKNRYMAASLRDGGATPGERVLAIVGAGHLAGRMGLVEMLRAEGLTVERVMLPGEAP